MLLVNYALWSVFHNGDKSEIIFLLSNNCFCPVCDFRSAEGVIIYLKLTLLLCVRVCVCVFHFISSLTSWLLASVCVYVYFILLVDFCFVLLFVIVQIRSNHSIWLCNLQWGVCNTLLKAILLQMALFFKLCPECRSFIFVKHITPIAWLNLCISLLWKKGDRSFIWASGDPGKWW
jgi:hypothetical protein